MTLVRIATRDDEPEIIRLLHMMHSEGGLQPLHVDAAKLMFDRAFDRKGGIIGVIGERGDIAGMICMLITRSWYTWDNHLEEVFSFVRPDQRQSNHAKTLIEFAKNCAVELSLPLLIGVMTNSRMAAKVRLYRARLGNPAGAFFVFNSKWDAVGEPTTEDFWNSIESRSERRQRERRDKWLSKQTHSAVMA